MDATSALFSVSLLLLVGVYGIYWLDSRGSMDTSGDSGTNEPHSSQDPTV